MSTYIRKTKHPITGEWHCATWIDDYYGSHEYGVEFPDGKVFRQDKFIWETDDNFVCPFPEGPAKVTRSSNAITEKIIVANKTQTYEELAIKDLLSTQRKAVIQECIDVVKAEGKKVEEACTSPDYTCYAAMINCGLIFALSDLLTPNPMKE